MCRRCEVLPQHDWFYFWHYHNLYRSVFVSVCVWPVCLLACVLVCRFFTCVYSVLCALFSVLRRVGLAGCIVCLRFYLCQSLCHCVVSAKCADLINARKSVSYYTDAEDMTCDGRRGYGAQHMTHSTAHDAQHIHDLQHIQRST